MIRIITRSLALAGCLLASPSQAALPDNVLLQREAMNALTLTLQLQGESEGMNSRQHQELMNNIALLKAHAATSIAITGYIEGVDKALTGLEAGRKPASEDMDRLYGKLIRLIETLHQPEADAPYVSVLMTEYLTLRYVFVSYIGIPSPTEAGKQYYQTNVNDLLDQLDQQIAGLLPRTQDSSLSARWRMLHHALEDMHEGWTRTRSGKPFTPLIVAKNASVLSDQLTTLLGS